MFCTIWSSSPCATPYTLIRIKCCWGPMLKISHCIRPVLSWPCCVMRPPSVCSSMRVMMYFVWYVAMCAACVCLVSCFWLWSVSGPGSMIVRMSAFEAVCSAMACGCLPDSVLRTLSAAILMCFVSFDRCMFWEVLGNVVVWMQCCRVCIVRGMSVCCWAMLLHSVVSDCVDVVGHVSIVHVLLDVLTVALSSSVCL